MVQTLVIASSMNDTLCMYVCMYVCICSKDWVIERASEVFSLVMKTHICLKHMYTVVTSNKGAAFQSRAQRAPSPLLGIHTKNHAPTIPRSSPLKA